MSLSLADLEKEYKRWEAGKAKQAEMANKGNQPAPKFREVPTLDTLRRSQVMQGTDPASISIKQSQNLANKDRRNLTREQEAKLKSQIKEEKQVKKERAQQLNNIARNTGVDNISRYNSRFSPDKPIQNVDPNKLAQAQYNKLLSDKRDAERKAEADAQRDNNRRRIENEVLNLQSKGDMRTMQEDERLNYLLDSANERGFARMSSPYLVSKDRYNQIMQDTRLRNDLEPLAMAMSNGSGTKASGTRQILGQGYNSVNDYIDQLSRRYELTPDEIKDVVKTYLSEKTNEQEQKLAESTYNFAQKHPGLGSGLSLAADIGGAVEGAYNVAAGGLTGDERNLSNMFSTLRNAPRQGVADTIDNGALRTGYQMGMGLGDLGVGVLTGNPALMMAGNTANDAMSTAVQNGSNVRTASAYALGAGVIDFVTNKIGLDKAKSLAVSSLKSTGVKNALAKNAIAGLGEAGENVIQDVAQSFLDQILNGENSELNTSYNQKIASNMSEEEAFKAVAKEYAEQLATSAGTGYLMGSAMQGIPTLVKNAEAGYLNRKLDKNSKSVMDRLAEFENAENNQRIEDINKDKADNVLSGNGLQLSDLKATSDPIFKGNVPQNGENVNRLPQASQRTYESDIADWEALENKYTNLKQYSEDPVKVTKQELPQDLVDYAVDENYDNQPESTKIGTELARRGYNVMENGGNNNILRDEWSILNDAVAHGLAEENIPASIMAEAYDTVYQQGGTLNDAIKLAAEMAGTKLNESDANVGSNIKLGEANAAVAPAAEQSARSKYFEGRNLIDNRGLTNKIKFDNDADNQAYQQARKDFFGVYNKYSAEPTNENWDRLYEAYSNLKNAAAKGYELDNSARDAYKQLKKDFADKTKGMNIKLSDTDLAELTDHNITSLNRKLATLGNNTGLKFRKNSGTPIDVLWNDIVNASGGQLDPNLGSSQDMVAALLNYVDDLQTKVNNPTTERMPADIDRFIPDEFWDLTNNIANTGSSNGNKVMAEDIGINPDTEFEDGDTIESEPIEREGFKQEGLRRTITNSLVNAGILTPEEAKNHPDVRYNVEHFGEVYDEASKNISVDGENIKNDYVSGKKQIDTALDVAQGMILLQDGDLSEPEKNSIMRNMYMNGTDKGRFIQAFANYANTKEQAFLNATKVSVDETEHWKGRNKKAREGNKKIANALKQIGYDRSMDSPEKAPLTFEQIRKGVLAEIEREVGSIEGKFTDKDIDFLTMLAADKNVPTWVITSEIEHKLNTGDFYTLDESTEPPKPTNRRLQNAFDRLVNEEVRPEKEPKTIDQIREEVKNTLDREYAGVASDFTDSDIDYIANMIHQNFSADEIAEALNTKMATGRFGISEETQDMVNRLFEMAKHYDENSKEFVEAQAEAFRLLAEEVAPKASALEKFDTWRYIAMLGNPKTMLRNFVGNKMFGALTGVSNTLAAAMESGADKLSRMKGGEGIERTKAVLNPAKDKGLIEAAKEDAYAKRYRSIEGSKYEKMDKDALRQSRSVYNPGIMRVIEKAVDRGISDTKAVVKKYSTSMAGYMKANGLTKADIDASYKYDELNRSKNLLSNSERAELDRLREVHTKVEKARDYALKQAEYATFHEDNAIAEVISKFSKINTGTKVLTEGLIPFKKTPLNILRSGIEYSPLGAIKSIAQTGKLIYENTGGRKGNLDDTYKRKNPLTGKDIDIDKTLASDVIQSWSQTMTGSAMAALGYYLFSKGILHSSSEDEKYQDELEGKQNYSIEINGKTYTIDWAVPGVMPLLLGAEVKKAFDENAILDEKWYENPDRMFSTLSGLFEPLVETSMLQGVENTLSSLANKYDKSSKAEKAANVISSLGINYLTQAVPTLSGQFARTIDNTRRTTDTKNQGFIGNLEKQGRKVMNKIPGFSMLNTPYINARGEQQNNAPYDNPLARFAYQTLSPWYAQEIDERASDRIARNAYDGLDENGKPIRDADVFADWKSYVTLNGKRLTPKQMYKYREAAGTVNTEIREGLAKENWFENLSADEQTQILKSVNNLVDHVGKKAAVDTYSSSSKIYEAYESNGVPGVMDYLKGQSDKKATQKLTDSLNTSTTSNAFKSVEEKVAAGDIEGAQKLTSDYETLKQTFSETHVLSIYDSAKAYDPSLTTDEFTKTFKAIDADGNQGLKKAEIVDYMNRNHLGLDQGTKILNMYGKMTGSKAWKEVPHLEQGVWK